MSIQVEPQVAVETGGVQASSHRMSLLAGLLTLAAIAWLLMWYGDTSASMVAIWRRSDTFAHGFLIFPISAWLIWRKRAELGELRAETSFAGAASLALLGALWLLANLAEVQVVQQFALIGMIPAMVLALLGWRVTRALAFPLAFLFLAVPVGEALIPPLMNFTADFTIAALQLTGIPVYREGTFFSIPSGDWSIVEGCSGLRYLIASFTGGCLFAYLSYRRLPKRLLFVAASIVVPVIANGLRAYMIVMIAHLSDMRLALGIDHFIYGWVFFGIVMLLLFWLGSYWQDSHDAEQTAPHNVASAKQVPLAGIGIMAAASILIAAAWPLYAARLEARAPVTGSRLLQSPLGSAAWHIDPTAMTDWRPRYLGTDASLFQVYRKGELQVALYLGLYRRQRQGAELINSQNVMIEQKHPVWRNVGERSRTEAVGRFDVAVRETRLRSPVQRLLIWDWFFIGGRHLSDPYFAKLLLAWDKLRGRPDDAVAIIVATPSQEHTEQAEKTLRAFVTDMLPAIERSLQDATASHLAQRHNLSLVPLRPTRIIVSSDKNRRATLL
jgi:exosortase A